MPAQAIIALILAALDIVEKAPSLIAALKQNKELTRDEESLLDARISKLRDLPHWKV